MGPNRTPQSILKLTGEVQDALGSEEGFFGVGTATFWVIYDGCSAH